jgi:hypothetical protein
MAKQLIDIGSTELAGDGESIRSAFGKINENFTEIYNLLEPNSLKELTQDYVSEMLLNGDHHGIYVSYPDEENKFNIVVEQDLDGGAASTIYDNETILDGGGA